MRELPRLQEQFLRVLSKAQELRPQKSERIGDELEWVIYEREVMLRAVNAVRSQMGLLIEATLADVKRAEDCAVGHVDYSRKFALYCAELALEGSNDRSTG